MLLLLLPAVLALALASLVWRWARVRRYWAARGVVHPPPSPLWGSLGFLQRENPYIWMRKHYAFYSNSPYIGIWLFWRPALLIRSPELAKNILVKDSEVFRNRLLGSGSNDPIGSLNIFTVNDPTWTSIRRRLTPVFTASKLRNLHELMKTKARELVLRIKRESHLSTQIDMRVIYADFMTDIVGTASFGVQSDATLTGDSPMRVVTRDFMAYSFWRGLAWNCIFFIPELVPYLGFTLFPKASTDYFRTVYSKVVAQRGGKPGPGKDLMDALLRMKEEAKADGEDLSEDLLISQAAIFLNGGFDCVAITYTTYELAYSPDIQERLCSELSGTRDRLGVTELDPSALSDLPYLNAVIKETLRKYPAMGWLDRIASQRYKVDENLTIEKGTPVYVCAAGMHYDPAYYPDPEKYDPERFLPENESKIVPFTYLPFGDGPRNCIGLRFAQQVLRTAISALVLNFEFRPHVSAPTPAQFSIDKHAMFLTPAEPLSVLFVPRADT